MQVHALRRIQHPHVLKLQDCFVQHTTVRLVTELARGELFDYIVAAPQRAMEGGPAHLSEDTSRDIAVQLLEAVASMHRNGVMHRGTCLSATACRGVSAVHRAVRRGGHNLQNLTVAVAAADIKPENVLVMQPARAGGTGPFHVKVRGSLTVAATSANWYRLTVLARPMCVLVRSRTSDTPRCAPVEAQHARRRVASAACRRTKRAGHRTTALLRCVERQYQPPQPRAHVGCLVERRL